MIPQETFPVVHFIFGGIDTASDQGSGRPYAVIWDGTCKVCGRLVKLLDKWDTSDRIETIPYQNTSVLNRFPWIPPERYPEAMQLVGPGGQTWEGSAAIEQLLGILPRGWLLGWAYKLPFAGAFFDRFYRWFARNRYRFGCGEHCQLRPGRMPA